MEAILMYSWHDEAIFKLASGHDHRHRSFREGGREVANQEAPLPPPPPRRSLAPSLCGSIKGIFTCMPSRPCD